MGKRGERLIPPKKQSGGDRKGAKVSLGSTRLKSDLKLQL